MDLQPFRDAKLGPTDLAKLLPTKRVSISNWMNGHSVPHHLVAPQVHRLLDTVKRAVDAGELPVPRNVPRRERWYYVQQVLARYAIDDALAD